MNLSKIERNVHLAAKLLKATANPQRLLLLCHLTKGEKSVGELEELLGMRQANLSQHLGRLRQDKLVLTRRDARTIYYSLGSVEAERLIRLLYEMFCAGTGSTRVKREIAAATNSAEALKKVNGSPARLAAASSSAKLEGSRQTTAKKPPMTTPAQTRPKASAVARRRTSG